MASKLLSTDQQNFTRLGMGCVDLIKLVLKDILKIHIQPKDLYTAINSCSELTTGISRLRPEQRSISFISPPFVPDYEDFDVSLLYTLIRNLCLNLKPTQGWGKTPTTTEIQIGDDIERLRLFRNGMFAHLKSTAIPDTEFSLRCNDLQNILLRTQAFVISKGYSANYMKELTFIEKSEFGFRDMEKYRILLEGVMHLLERSENEEIPKISINGQDKVLCGEMVLFEAEVEHSSKSASRPIIWQKRRRIGTEQIDTTAEKYEGSTSRRLVIKRVSKEDEGEYQALISWVSGGQTHSTTSNSILLKALGERANLKKLDVRTGTEGITLLYQYTVSENSPKVEHITWKKNGEILKIDQKKYLGGSLMGSYLTITTPTCEDAGTYTCIVANAVGGVSESQALDLPNATISTENSVVFGNETRIDSTIKSCPECERVSWQKSLDSLTFETIDVGVPKYYGTKLDPRNPVLVLRKATFDDKLYYRLRTENKIGECSSNIVSIKVTGDLPNISNCLVTNIKNHSFSFICEIILSEDSPHLKEIFWMKDGDLIEIDGSGGKYTGGTISDASLVINDVNEFDAGSYQCKASNALGTTSGEEIVLSVPDIKVEGPEKTENGSFVFTATTYSFPAVFAVQWSKKNKENDGYTPIDVYKEEYTGSSNSLSHPVLVIKQGPLHNHGFKLKAANFVGINEKKIPDDIPSPTDNTANNKVNRLAAIFKKRGSSIRFNNLRLYLIRNIPEEELFSLKESLKVITARELPTIENIKTVQEFFAFLLDEGIFNERNVIMMQYVLRSIERPDLERKCVEYARKEKPALCYFEETKKTGDLCENDVKENVELHVADDIEQFTDIDSLLSTVAAIVGCDESCITVVGVRPSNSFIIVISMKEEYVRTLREKGPVGLNGLLKYHVDCIHIENEVINIAQGESQNVSENQFSLSVSPEEIVSKLTYILEKIRGLLLMKEYDEDLRHELSRKLPNYMTILENRKRDITKKDRSIVIAGEISAGKTTLINSLLGEEIFATSNAASTGKIVRIRNSEILACKYYTRQGKLKAEQNASYLRELKKLIRRGFDCESMSEEDHKDIYYVDVLLPFPILKGNGIIVETPGIGESQEVDKILLDFLPDAVSFIFVVNARNAGEFQVESLQGILRNMNKNREKMPCFDPKEVLFVTNQWDIVEDDRDEADGTEGAKERTWRIIKEKLARGWTEVEKENIFMVSLKQVLNKTENEYSFEYTRFRKFLDRTVKRNVHNRLRNHFRFLETIMQYIESGTFDRLDYLSKKEADKLKQIEKSRTKIDVMESDCKMKRKQFVDDLNDTLDRLVNKLWDYLHSTSGKMIILNPAGRGKIENVPYADLVREIPKRVEEGVKKWCESSDCKSILLEAENRFQNFVKEIPKRGEEGVKKWCESSDCKSIFFEAENWFQNFVKEISVRFQVCRTDITVLNVSDDSYDVRTVIAVGMAVLLPLTFVAWALSIILAPAYLAATFLWGKRWHKRKVDEIYDTCINNISKKDLREKFAESFGKEYEKMMQNVFDESIPNEIRICRSTLKNLELERQLLKDKEESLRILQWEISNIRQKMIEIRDSLR